MKKTIGFITILLLALCLAQTYGISLAGPIEDLKPGEWYEVPNSKIRSVLPNPIPPGNGPESIIEAWNSGAYDTKRDRLIITGGGHNDYGGNEIYTFDINTLKWSRTWGPSPNIPLTQGACNETYSDGSPASRHTYDSLEYLSGVDKFFMFGGSLYCGSGGAATDTWTFDFNTLSWSAKADFPTCAQLEMVSAYDSVTGHVFINGPASCNSLLEYNPQANTWTTKSSDSVGYGHSATLDPKRRKFISVGKGQAYIFDLTLGSARQTLSTTGGSVVISASYPGMDYDPVSDRIVAWVGGASVYSLNLDTRVWSRIDPAPTNTVTPTPPAGSGTYGRWRYISSKNVFIVVNSIDENVFIYKLSSLPGQIDIPSGVFVALELPDIGEGIGRPGTKHVTWAHNPLNGRLYSMGGDFETGDGSPASYHQDTYSLSLLERWNNPTDRNAGWRQEYPYCGPDGGIQPKSPDFVGWTWDSKRNAFWMIPGTMVQPVRQVCPDETVSENDDPKYKFRHIMTFNPAEPDLTKRWKDISSNPGPYSNVEFWQSFYDPVTDSIIRPSYDGGIGDVVSHYNIQTGTWASYFPGTDATGSDHYIHRGMIAADISSRYFYAIGGDSGRLYRYHIDLHKMDDLGPVPGGPLSFGSDASNNTYVAWDSVNKVLLFFRVDTRTIHIYHPDTGVWGSPSTPLNTAYAPGFPSGLKPWVRHAMVFDPYQNLLVFLGNTEIDDVAGGNPYMYLYRYASNPLKGDVNKDSSIDILDVQALVNHILGTQDYGSSADANEDGSVDVLDVQLVVNIILGG